MDLRCCSCIFWSAFSLLTLLLGIPHGTIPKWFDKIGHVSTSWKASFSHPGSFWHRKAHRKCDWLVNADVFVSIGGVENSSSQTSRLDYLVSLQLALSLLFCQESRIDTNMWSPMVGGSACAWLALSLWLQCRKHVCQRYSSVVGSRHGQNTIHQSLRFFGYQTSIISIN